MSSTNNPPSSSTIKEIKPKPYPFYLGGVAASISACFTHPLDVAKTRLQTAKSRQGLIGTLIGSAKSEGISKGIYAGLSASLLRQMTYSVVRFGSYDYLKSQMKPIYSLKKDGSREKRYSPWSIAIAASLAGAIGGIAGNPADIILVRMTSDLNKEPNKRYNYSNALTGLLEMTKKEGLTSLFRGVIPNTIRAILMNASQLATYDVSKDFLLSTGYYKEGTFLHFSASFIAGTVATTVCSPADVIKARVMATSNNQSNSSKSNNMFFKIKKAINQEGIGFLFRGWTPAWVRLSPNTIIIFLVLEKLRLLVDKSRENKEKQLTLTKEG